ncbi:MAG: hypothetical protein FWD19_02645 [Defluviitaleaceae bacterium]|nr:hypothetical protein [Defluviitaleaceae bacterium]
MNTIEKKFKNLAVGAFFVAIFAAAGAIFGGSLAVGGAIGAAIALIGFFILHSTAAAYASDTKNEANQIATTISSMAAGNFSANFRGDSKTELGQIEAALSQFSAAQKNFTNEIESFTRNENFILIDEKKYSGNYRETVKGINAMATNHAEISAAIAAAMKALANENSYGANFSYKNEIGNAFSDLRKKFEAMNRDLRDAVSAAEKAQAEIVFAREQTEAAKKDAAKSREEANEARHKAATAQREADRANSQLRSASPLKKPVPIAPRPAPAPTPAIRTASAPTAPTKLAGANDSPTVIKSVKISAPSGAHEYDRRDYGKY